MHDRQLELFEPTPDEDDPSPPKEWDFWDYFNRQCEQMLAWARACGLIP